MRRLALAAALLSAPATSIAAPIIGGTATTAGEFPNVVGIEINIGNEQALCTGELIAPDWVLTAAHCLDPKNLKTTDQATVTAATAVEFDAIDVHFSSTRVQIRAKATYYDTRYDASLYSHDLGLIELVDAVHDITPAVLNFDGNDSPVGVDVTMVGYGTTMEGSSGSQGAAGVEYELDDVPSVSCAKYGLSNANLLCYDQTDGKGKCEGDSGGPSFATIAGVQTVVGITSFGDGSCSLYGADTRPEADEDFLRMYLPDGLVPPAASGGCAAAVPGDAPPPALVIGVALFGLVLRRRRR